MMMKKLVILIILAASCSGAAGQKTAEAAVETYSYSAELAPSLLYNVCVNGARQFVYPTEEPHICAFGCDSEVEIEVTSPAFKLESVVVRPLNKNYSYNLSKDKLVLKLNAYDRAVVEFNGDEEHPLFIFANPPERGSMPDPADPSVKFFAAGGIYTENLINLEAGQTLYIQGGAVVNGCLDLKEKDNITVDGCGILNCHPGKSRGIFIHRCNNFTLKNIIELNRDNWTSFFAECRGLRADNYKVVAPISANGAENDAFDIMGCNDVIVRRCFSYCHDDAFCIKCRKWNYGGPSSDILIEDCIAWNCKRGNTFEFGYELQEDATDITFRNNYAIHSAGNDNVFRRGGIGLHNGAGGTVSNVLYENIYIEDPKEYGIHMVIIDSGYNIGTGVVWSPGKIRNVTLRNVSVSARPPQGNFINGLDEGHRIENIVFENLRIAGKKITCAADGDFDIKYADVIFK